MRSIVFSLKKILFNKCKEKNLFEKRNGNGDNENLKNPRRKKIPKRYLGS